MMWGPHLMLEKPFFINILITHWLQWFAIVFSHKCNQYGMLVCLATTAGIEDVEFVCGRAEDVLQGQLEEEEESGGPGEVIGVVDPPRAGLRMSLPPSFSRSMSHLPFPSLWSLSPSCLFSLTPALYLILDFLSLFHSHFPFFSLFSLSLLLLLQIPEWSSASEETHISRNSSTYHATLKATKHLATLWSEF